MLRTTLLSALGVTLLAASVQAQTSAVYPPATLSASSDDGTTGSVSQDGQSGLPGYNDPYARPPARSGYGERAPVGAPQASGGYVQPGYGYQPGAAQASAPSNQPMPIAPSGLVQGGAPAAQGSSGPYEAQPGYAVRQPVQASYDPNSGGGYQDSSSQDQMLRSARAAQGGAGMAPSAPQQATGYPQATPATYVPAGRDYAPAPAGSYSANASVVPGTTQAPSGPRIEDVDPSEPVDARFRRQVVDFATTQPAGTIVIDTPNTFLYLVMGGGKAMRYGIGVGREGFTWSGTEKITRKAEWADWRPPPEMIERQPYLPRFMAGGPGNPLGARTMYLGSTVYRIHGTNEPQTIGKFVSSGCIRLLNADVEDLYERVKVGTKVVIMPKTAQSAAAQPAGMTGAPARATVQR